MDTLLSLAAACLLAALHVLSPLHAGWRDEPRRPVLTFASGVAIAFVLVQLIPTVEQGAAQVRGTLATTPLGGVNRPLHYTILLGLVGVFALDHTVKASRRRRHERGVEDRASLALFVLAVTVYGALNASVGYLLQRQAEQGLGPLFLLVFAKGFAFLVLDHAYHADFGWKYKRYGRWIAAGADLFGWGLYWVLNVGEAVVHGFLSLLGGAILYNVLKEETLPQRHSSFLAFTLGAASYAAAVLALA